jgi:para-aminobenzoate synthetase/4-amino-4-deoxychorismate lyase
LEDVKDTFFELEDFISRGYYIAGFISYEAGFSFEENLRRLNIDPGFPLVWFGVYNDPVIFTHREKIDLLPDTSSKYATENLRSNISRRKYTRDIERIKGFIRKGDTYQVNYTFKYRFDFSGSIYSFYEELKAKQSVSYSALIKTPEFSILSLSPELFFRKDKDRVEVRPMKGTFGRGRNLEEDGRHVEMLKDSLKNRSENVMIVDLLRNDLGRICRTGTVKTKRLFEVERYETLLQMISIVRGVLKKGVSVYGLLKAIFPSGSVTGAPKISTMKIINSLENEPRRIYTGSIGFIAPDAKAVFNVAIRTVLINNNTKKAEMGIGSGIVYDSDSQKEFDECRLKADFITKKKSSFKLIETLLWEPGKGYFLLPHHLDRLSSSAQYFNFNCVKVSIVKALEKLSKNFKDGYRYKIKILNDKYGKIKTSFSRINSDTKIAKVRFFDKKISSSNIFLYHKTTNRILYDEEYKRWSEKGYFDVIFMNERNQVTEGAISNIIIKKGAFYYTPPIECGLLNGIYRRYLLEKNSFPLIEKILYREDIKDADEIYMVNSVRGMTRVIA